MEIAKGEFIGTMGKGVGKGRGTGVVYLNGKPLGRMIDGEYDFDPVTVRSGDVITFKRDDGSEIEFSDSP
jgi:outer membrane lipoprotein SlyB